MKVQDKFKTVASERERKTVHHGQRILYAWGDNSFGELSVGPDQADQKKVRLPTPVKLPNGVNFAQVALGLKHTVALSTNSSVYTCGTWIYGLLGTGTSRDCRRLRKVQSLEQYTRGKQNPVVSIACGDRHSIALTQNGEIFSWGGALHGKLGRTSPGSGPFQVMSALSGKRVVKVACGNCHSAAVTDEGELWTWGGGGKFFNKGQLGLSSTTDTTVPVRVDAFASIKIKIKDVVCGGMHTLALSDTCYVYSWGRGDFGQLGLADDTHESEPKLIEALAYLGRVHALAAGENHSLACMDKGDVYSFGYGQQGQLGHGVGANERSPRKIKSFSDRGVFVVQIAAGWRHSICLTRDGEVYTWGHGDKGQLGHGDTKSCLTARVVEELRGRDVRQIAAGGSHSLAFTAYFMDAQDMVFLRGRKESGAEDAMEKSDVMLMKDQEDPRCEGNDETQESQISRTVAEPKDDPPLVAVRDDSKNITDQQRREQGEKGALSQLMQGKPSDEQYRLSEAEHRQQQEHDRKEREQKAREIRELEEQKAADQMTRRDKTQQQAMDKLAERKRQQAMKTTAEQQACEIRKSAAFEKQAIEIVYSCNVQYCHRFAIFQCQASEATIKTKIDKYLEYRKQVDAQQLFDDVTFAPGNLLPIGALPGFEPHSQTPEHGSHVFSYDNSPTRATLMMVTSAVPPDGDENLWPVWAAQHYRMIVEPLAVFGVSNISFREIRPMPRKSTLPPSAPFCPPPQRTSLHPLHSLHSIHSTATVISTPLPAQVIFSPSSRPRTCSVRSSPARSMISTLGSPIMRQCTTYKNTRVFSKQTSFSVIRSSGSTATACHPPLTSSLSLSDASGALLSKLSNGFTRIQSTRTATTHTVYSNVS